jgi:NADH-quinone oxidoreductase subunit N
MLLGLSYIYGAVGSLYYTTIAANFAVTPLTILAVVLFLAGMGFKLSLVPFHLWTADVYQGAPTPVTGYLSVISKGAAAFAFMVILTQVFGSLYTVAWKWMLYALIVLTITLGNLFAIRQRNMKRFLAFSSVSQAGYIMLGVVAANEFGLASLMYYVLVYVLSNLAAFAVIGAIENKTGKVMMSDYDGLRSTNPWLSFAMMLAMFSLAGIPPFAGFFSKFFIFAGALSTGNVALYVLVFIALLNTIISLYYYLLVVKAMFINKPGEGGAIETFKSSCTERTAMVICVLGIMLVGIVSCIYGFLVEAAAGNVIGVF